jgi:sulfite exporter TauE/SafE
VSALVVSVFVASLLGSVHCAAMCGSFACLAAGGGRAGYGAVRGTVGYHLGRLLSYSLLGALAGAAGGGLDHASGLAGPVRPAAIVAGALLIAWGFATLLGAFGVRVPALSVPPALGRVLAHAMGLVQRRPPAVRGLAIGVLTAAIPCGWLYAFVATAAAAGDAAGGATVMAVFWGGTLPLLVTVGLAGQRLLGSVRTRLPAVTAAILVVLGALTAAGRFGGMVH